jgi:hypothetical protein
LNHSPRLHRLAFPLPVSQSYPSRISNPKSEYRAKHSAGINPKQTQHSNDQIFLGFTFCISVTRVCFEMIPLGCFARISCFVFITSVVPSPLDLSRRGLAESPVLRKFHSPGFVSQPLVPGPDPLPTGATLLFADRKGLEG